MELINTKAKKSKKLLNQEIKPEDSIHRLFITFLDKQLEVSFLEWTFPAQYAFFGKIVYFGIFATIIFAIPDLYKEGFTNSFLISLGNRLIFSVCVLIVYHLMKRKIKAITFFRLLFLITIFITINTSLIILEMGNHSIIYALSEIIAIMMFYVLLRTQFIPCVISAIIASVCFTSVHIIYGNLDASSLNTIIYAYILANVFGIMYNRSFNESSRKEYMSLIYEQKLNQRLEKEIEQRLQVEGDLLSMARTDYLTGLANRLFFRELAEQEVHKCERYHHKMSLLTLDLDWFKKVNDRYGHTEGDYVLINFASSIQSMIRKSDIFARMGGEEFVILTPNTDLKHGKILAENLRKFIAAAQLGSVPDVKITVSVGVAQYKKGDNLTTIQKKSDQALYEAKKSGRNCVVCFTKDSHKKSA